MNRYIESQGHRYRQTIICLCLLLAMSGSQFAGELLGRELLPQKEQEITGFGETNSRSLDEQKRGTPQAMFVWIHMAKGYEVEWDSFGRQGWYTQDPRLKPIAPGTTVFPPDTPAIYVVFETAPLEDPAQFSAQWFLEDDAGKPSDAPVGRDTLEVPGHERYGFLELKKPSGGWVPGKYLLKIFITPLGQQSYHAVNQVGTMRFQIVNEPAVSGASAK
jgi:hypothetical protein